MASDPLRHSWVFDSRGKPSTLQEALVARTGLSRNHAKRLIDSRQVFVNGRRVWMCRHAVHPGDRIDYASDREGESTPFHPVILVDTPSYLIVDKPAGLESVGAQGLEPLLQKALHDDRLRVVHRLDRDTTGCLVVARHPEAFDALLPVFRERRVLKIYQAIVRGSVAPAEQTLRTPLDGQPAVTHVRVLDANPQASHLRVKIDTGRTHQIRRHLLGIGHPLVGDAHYGTRDRMPEALRAVRRQMLHAAAIEFPMPGSDQKIRGEARLPPDFKACLKLLRLT